MDRVELLGAAEAVAARAHSPYSEIRVGAALRARDGAVYTGCNVENASYGLTMCAERNALAHAVAEGARDFVEVAIWNSTGSDFPPCGACRQVLHEFAPELLVHLAAAGGEARTLRLADLLPEAFRLD